MGVRAYAGAVLLAGAAVVAVGAQKITTPEELDKVMKKVGPANQATQKAINSNNFAEARTQIAIVKQGVLDSQTFWVEHKREDALKFNKDTLAKLGDLEKVLATDPVDPAAAMAAFKTAGASCRSCHQIYRATDADNNFILKPGSLGG